MLFFGGDFPTDGGGEESRGLRRAGSGSGQDTLQTPEDPFPPAQSHGVWEVHRTMEVGPAPEQREDGGVIKCQEYS